MATGMRNTVQGNFTDTSLPIRRDHPLLTNGSLMLVMPTFSTRPWPAGIPAHGALLPNIADAEARALVPTGELSAKFSLTGTLNDNVRGKVERTSKGGLHAIVSQTVWTGYHGLAILVPDAIRDYLCANSAHVYYYSLKGRITRAVPAGSGVGALANFGRFASSATQGAWLLSQGDYAGVALPIAPNRAGAYTDNLNAVGTRFTAVAGTPSETMPAASYVDDGARNIAQWGAMLPYTWTTPIKERLQSWIFYESYLEDLTVSGRSFATVQALDQAQYVKQIQTAGGNYFGDTFTDPATLP